ncbi:MAG: right-handed parallel beta-helix repeat-containing protein [Chloroflexi bacterium]|nr:right-handed parallel beta-helix repeat-containing protein [Chloroflexota bacterium]
MIGVQTITFNIPGTGVKQIFLSDSLRFTSSAILDASTQPGYAGSPLIEIVPYSATSPVDGIVVNGANPTVYDPATSVTIRGVAIGGFVGGGILLGNGQSHVVEDSYIGTNAAGTEANGNDTGIFVRAPNSIIRNNLISGNNNVGLYIYSNGGRNGNNNSIVGNFIGTDVTGEYPLPNSYGIRLTEGALNNVVGGATLADANLISANLNNGILIDGNSNANVVAGNIIGLDATGDYLLGNGGTGIYVSQATNTVIGGDTPEAGNEIWGNLSGIAVINQSDNTIVRNNVIAQNGSTGISVLANGTQLIENVVAFHTNAGVTIGSGTGNRISMNRVYSNGGMGIDLGGIYSVLPNDVGDVDNGANGLQNYPVITSVVTGGGSSTITGSLSSKANSTYRVEFFTNAVCDATGYGEGQTYLGYTDVTTNANGVANFSVQYPPINSGATFGINWSAAFFASSNLTGTAVNVSGINGLNFNWGSGLPIVNGNAVPGMPADNFSARFTSTQSFAAGTYNFVASSDDGVRVYIDGVLRLDKFFGRPLTTDQFSVTLTTGTHNLVVEYFEGIDTASLQLNWSLNGGAPNVVTSTATDALGNTSGFSACRAVQTILGVGSIQETSSALIYQGNWVSLTGAGNGGGFKYTTDPNARVSFWVDSSVSRVTFYRTIHPAYGSTQIFLDNGTTPFATMVNTSATIANGVPYTIVLPAGGHRIELRNVGTAYSSLDQIDLLGAAATLQTGTYQDTDANLTFVGNWVHNPMAGAYGGSRRYTNDPNGRVIFNIDNSVGRILVYRTLYQTGSYGSMQILVDGALTTTMPNNPSSTVVYGVPFAFEVTPGSHTIEFRNVGSTYSDIDQIVLLPAATPMSVGTFQEADAGLTYSGNWTSVSNVGALGGSRRYTNDPNARVFFYTDSSVGRVTIYRTIAGSTFGSMQVYVDGTLHSTFANNTSTTVQYGVPNTFLVTPGTHRIELRNVGTTFGDIDQLVLQPAPASLGVGVYQETDSELIYMGNWTSIAGGGALGGSRRYTNDPLGRAAFNIDSSVGKVTIYRTVAGSSFGTMQVYVDGVLNSTIANNTASAVQYGVPFTILVTPGNHTVELRNVGNKFGDLDQITLEAPTAALGIDTYQETNAELTYIGNWTSIAGGGALGGTRRYTNDPSARVSFNVDSTVGRVTIYRTIAGSTFGAMQVYVDGVLNGTIANNTASAVQYGVPYTFPIAPGNHTIELRNTISKFSDLDQIVLEAPTTALGVNTYQETTPELSYAGNWTNIAGGGALGGTRRYTNDPNARVSFNIDSSVGKVTIYRTVAGSTFGTMQVYVDGVLNSTIANNTSSTVQFGVPYTFAVIPGNHLIELRNGSATFSDIDQIMLDGPPAPLTVTTGTYQESSSDLIYVGSWTTISHAGALGGSRRYTNQPSARVSFTIDSSVGKITIYRTVAGSTFGTMQVYIDGMLSGTIANNTSSSVQYGVPYSFTVVPGNHTIELRNGSSTFSDLDQIVVEAS